MAAWGMANLTAQQFEQADGTADWRVLNAGADAWFATRSYAQGAALVRRVAEVAEAAGHHPDVDLRAAGVHFRLLSHDVGRLTERDVSLAAGISAAASELGLLADPTAVQRMQIVIDAVDAAAVVPFWRAALRYEHPGDALLVDPQARHPRIWFQPMDEARALRNRIHLDAGAPWEFVEDATAALLAAGGRVTFECPWWRTLADAEGNEVDVFPLSARHGLFDDPATADWRLMLTSAVHYATGSFVRGVELLEAVAGLADEAGLPLLIDLRYAAVTIDGGKDQHATHGFIDLARAVQSAARSLGLEAAPDGVRDLQVGIDALDVESVKAFWRAALGYVDDPRPDLHDLYDPRRLSPPVFLQQMDEPREQRNRIHIDLFVPADQAEARIAAAVAAGGRLVDDPSAPEWWTLADPEGNELDIAVAVGREERAQEATR